MQAVIRDYGDGIKTLAQEQGDGRKEGRRGKTVAKDVDTTGSLCGNGVTLLCILSSSVST